MEIGEENSAENAVRCMNGEDKEISYANNSLVQKSVILKTRRVLEDSIKDYLSNIVNLPTCLKVADLGCSSGPNALLPISEIIDIVHQICRQAELKSPEFQVFLNDLPGNDFNAIFRSVPAFLDKLKKEKGDLFGQCSISGVAGSFYGRLFPTTSLHLIHSSSSLHWLSKVPDGVENNKWNVYMAKSSPPNVFKAYAKQFHEDFSLFLRMRSEEIKPGGHMILSFMCRANPSYHFEFPAWKLLAKSLSDLVAEGLVKEADLDSFNIPIYQPCKEEVCDIVKEEGSFGIGVDSLEVFEVDRDRDANNNTGLVLDKYERGKRLAQAVRSVSEHLLVSHFGDSIIDKLFARLAILEAELLDSDYEKVATIVFSLTKK